MVIAKVEPLTRARALRGPFDYLLPERLGEVGVGSVLLVPFGRRRVLGVVVEIAERSSLPLGRLAEPLEALEAGAPADLVRLGLWVAREYCSTPARGLELVLPPGTASARGHVPARRRATARARGGAAAALAGDGRALGRRQRAVLERLVECGGPAPAAELGASRETLRRLERRGLVELAEEEVRRAPSRTTVGAETDSVELTGAQRAALDRVIGALDGRGGELLLHGVTGSGKTEVYLGAAAAALERGRGAIVLVPEIGLTPQAVARFGRRFGDLVAVLHSGLSAGERRDEWHRLREGDARICVGPRSAIFAPIADLGLIVVDEEHDASYKQEGDPRYDAREVARRRAEDSGAALVYGTATPRPESWARLERLELTERVDGRSLPAVEIVDMRGRDGRSGPLHERTRAALTALGRGAKAIVLVNRRGLAPYVCCRSCGHAWECPSCDVSLVLHRVSGLHCHHCGHREPLPGSCSECGSVAIARAGSGTERVEELIEAAVAPLPVFRLDSDTAARRGGHLEILSRFQAADGGVLVGTQMVAKGHDFPDVVLGVVLDADATLRFPDFRAEERAFALVAQLAGRSGRGEKLGRVIVQTLDPDATAIRHAAAHDAAGFLTEELARRRELSYPPYSHLIRVDLAGTDRAALDRTAMRLRAAIDAELPATASALGPAPRFRLRGRERRQILVKASDRTAAVGAVRAAVEGAVETGVVRNLALAVDVDPQ